MYVIWQLANVLAGNHVLSHSSCGQLELMLHCGEKHDSLPSSPMHSTVKPLPAAPRDRLRPLRYIWRAPQLLVHALLAFPLALVFSNPLLQRCRIRGERLDYAMTRWWSGRILRIFGFRISSTGHALPGAALFVANHVSWLDIELMHSQRIMSFVAKAEIARWPLVGWLATRAGTIFHQRGNGRSLDAVMQRVVERLHDNTPVGVFPEGSSGPGDRVRTFHARIFQVAVDAQVLIQPVALCYGNGGRMDLRVPFAADENFLANFLRLLGEPGCEVQVHFLEPLQANGVGRRQIADAARSAIAHALGCADA